MRIGIILRRYRQIDELTQEDLAKQIGISVASLGRLESGNPCEAENLVQLQHWLFTDGETKGKKRAARTAAGRGTKNGHTNGQEGPRDHETAAAMGADVPNA
jgi:transcriptional regulator with XRE-family HTH domain